MTLCAAWWALPLAAIGGWLVGNMFVISCVVLMAWAADGGRVQ